MTIWSSDQIKHARTLWRDVRGVALIEFAYSLPILVSLGLGGTELTNYITTKMRVSQVALHLADHASRAGVGDPLAPKDLREIDINDVLTGAGLQGGNLDIYTQGRVILSSLEPMANPNPTPKKFKIAWQRCRGAKAYTSTYGVAGARNLVGMGPAGRQVTAPDDGGTMFVEVSYTYRPLFLTSISDEVIPSLNITSIATMPVRDRRNYAQIYNNENAPVARCT